MTNVIDLADHTAALVSQSDRAELWRIVNAHRRSPQRLRMTKLALTGAVVAIIGIWLEVHGASGGVGGPLVGLGTAISLFASVRMPAAWALDDPMFLGAAVSPDSLEEARGQLGETATTALRTHMNAAPDGILRVRHVLSVLDAPNARRHGRDDRAMATAQAQALSGPRESR